MPKYDDDIVRWISLKGGKRIPIRENQSVSEAVKQNLKNMKLDKDAKLNASTKPKENPLKKSIDADQKKKEAMIKQNTAAAKNLNQEHDYQNKLSQKVTVGNTPEGKLLFNNREFPAISFASANSPNAAMPRGDSLYQHLQNGTLDPQRQAVHREIIQKYFEGHKPYAPGEEKKVLFTGGGGASGKGQFSKNIGGYYSSDDNPILIDPDEIKKDLAAADGKKLDDSLTGFYHEESSALAKQIFELALNNDYPAMFDGTATNPGSVLKKLELAERCGYKTEMAFIYSDWNTVRQNSLDRYEKYGRLVPIFALIGAHQKAYNAVLALQDKFDKFTVYDNAGRTMRKVGQSSKGKNLSIDNAESWARFSKSRDEFTLSQAEIDKYLEDAAKISKKRARQQ